MLHAWSYSVTDKIVFSSLGQGGKEYLMRAHFGLPSVVCEDSEGKPPIHVKFEIPYFTTSGIQVTYPNVMTGNTFSVIPILLCWDTFGGLFEIHLSPYPEKFLTLSHPKAATAAFKSLLIACNSVHCARIDTLKVSLCWQVFEASLGGRSRREGSGEVGGRPQQREVYCARRLLFFLMVRDKMKKCHV